MRRAAEGGWLEGHDAEVMNSKKGGNGLPKKIAPAAGKKRGEKKKVKEEAKEDLLRKVIPGSCRQH